MLIGHQRTKISSAIDRVDAALDDLEEDLHGFTEVDHQKLKQLLVRVINIEGIQAWRFNLRNESAFDPDESVDQSQQESFDFGLNTDS